MAIGYSKLISQFDSAYFDSWVSFIKKEFVLFNSTTTNIHVVDYDGTLKLIDIKEAGAIFEVSYQIVIKFRNRLGNAITCTISVTHQYLAVEEYSMDELLTEEEYNNFYNLLLSRFQWLSTDKKLIGFIFDREGYSEDYISTDIVK
jgi:hypothetical protein